jgi:hypothetical protein
MRWRAAAGPLHGRARRHRAVAQDGERAIRHRGQGVDPAGGEVESAVVRTGRRIRSHASLRSRHGGAGLEDPRREPVDDQQIRHQLLGRLEPQQRLTRRYGERGEGVDRVEIESVGGLVELGNTAGPALRIGEPRIDTLPPRLLSDQVDADQNDRAPGPAPVLDVVGLAAEPERGVSLATESTSVSLTWAPTKYPLTTPSNRRTPGGRDPPAT